MTRVLTTQALNRALLHRQLLLERSPLSIEDALGQVAGLQAQYAPSGYVGLWTRLATFARGDLTAALEARRVAQATLMRSTIHLVAARDFWPFALGVRRARRQWMTRIAAAPPEAELRRRAADVREALAHGPRTVAELGGMASGFLGNLSLWVDLVRVPPSGTWERRRADRLALAESWLGPEEGTEAEGQVQLVRAYLRAFGPAPWRDIAAWSGLDPDTVRRAAASLDLAQFEDETGRELVDLAGAELPDPDTAAPVRFLAHWDSSLLVHARRTGLLPEQHRPRIFSTKNPFSVGVVLVDGRVVASWSVREGTVVLDSLEPIAPSAADEIEAERQALEAFHR